MARTQAKKQQKTARGAAKPKAKVKVQAKASAKAKARPAPAKSKPQKVVPLRSARPAKAPERGARGSRGMSREELHDDEVRAAEVREGISLGGRVAGEAGPSRGKYVYCIIRTEEDQSWGKVGIGPVPSEVHTIIYKDLAAVVSDTPIGILDPTRENVLAHQRVNETVMRDYTVLPMSFGTVFKTRDDIIELLKSAYQPFGEVLKKMEDKVEFGLKVLWDRDQVIKEIEADDEGLRRLKNEIASQKGSTYFARMQYGRMVDAALQARSERYVAEIFDALRDVSVASRTNKPIGDKMILNAAFLVARQKEHAFDAKVKEIGARLDKLTFKYTGPWPAYNFVNIRLKLERANAK